MATTKQQEQSPPKFTELNELAAQKNGGRVLFATDDWFAPAENLLNNDEPIFKPDLYTPFGKWMDGWETRRKRIPGHDWCIIKLGVPSIIRGFLLDTAFFTGNYAPQFSIQGGRLTPTEEAVIPMRAENMMGTACTPDLLQTVDTLDTAHWEELIPKTRLGPGYEATRLHYSSLHTSNTTWTHLRLNIYPDGGVARLRVYGHAFNPAIATTTHSIDLLAMENGGVCHSYSNAHYGHPRNLIRRGGALNMGDGWETARRLDRPPILEVDEGGILKVPGDEWAVFRMAATGLVESIDVDTAHFKGNFPDSVKIEGSTDLSTWTTLLPKTKLSPDRVHSYSKTDLEQVGPFSCVKVTIAPDGGLSRLRIFGKVTTLK